MPRSRTTTRRGSRGAQAVASAVFLARTGKTKEQIKNYIETGMALPLVACRPRRAPGGRTREARLVSWTYPAISEGRVRVWPWR